MKKTKKTKKPRSDYIIRADVFDNYNNSRIDSLSTTKIKDIKKFYRRLVKKL
jgi:hypothetical protein